MVTQITPQDPIANAAPPRFTGESPPDKKNIAGHGSMPTDPFERFMPKGESAESLNTSINEDIGALGGRLVEEPLVTEAVSSDSSLAPLALIPFVPVQQEVLAVQESVAPTDLQSAESFVNAEVSADVLSLAMSLQEEAQQAQTPLPPHFPKEPNGTRGEFPVLKEIALSGGQQNLGTPAQKDTMDLASMAEAETPEEGEITPVSLTRQPEKATPATSQNPKTREAVNGSSTLSVTGNARAFEGAARDSEAEADFEEDAALQGREAKGNKGADSKMVLEGKSFADNLASASAKTENSSNASESAGARTAQSADGKAIEAAFNRAPENSSVSGKNLTPQAQSTQQTLSPPTSAQEQIAFSIKNNAAKGKSEINLQLRPDSLGRVTIKIDINKEGQTYVIVATERSETRDLLQQDASKLTALLEDSGMSLEEGDISYNLFKDQAQQDKADPDSNNSGESEKALAEKAAEGKNVSMTPLEMSEVRIPRHGGTWEMIA